MARYIDADLLMKEFCDFVRPSNNSDFANVPTWNDAVSLVESAPTADVVEIVHCKDCSWCQLKRIRSSKFDSYFECILWGNPTTSEFYCAAGERRTDDGERSE